ncbi:hypothetical protein RJ639_012239 [Escallonia herrerae]|uniref:Protein kinase domain-containing protein n=1 Tax=Escallonia herrerae TaxID=1293975 RepID=A0AA88VVM2_9ASTE|nr:hypothetical protein RJ639_012239 [Escallonia herrerae]
MKKRRRCLKEKELGVEAGRVIGNYILGGRAGPGSFAVVWRSRHRQLGLEVAVKEIDKKHLPLTNPKPKSKNTVKMAGGGNPSNNLLKEISIPSNIRHPNIIRLFEAIETEDRIYLVLEYCDGGDLAAYLHRRCKLSQDVARHFMRQLASGLQVLNENRLIHRDLKPQNLLLSTNEATPLLKIGDFGFARYLKPRDLADTLCGSPLYMAPEIIQNKKYDSKADLWSAGAILFQMVTGRPPFDGNSQLQLFQNILTSGELRFPQDALDELHPDCIDLCQSLLRQNPVTPSMESIENEYVLVNAPWASTETLIWRHPCFIRVESLAALPGRMTRIMLLECERRSWTFILFFSAGFYLEAFSVELVVLAIWKEAIQVCSSWLASINDDSCSSDSANVCVPVEEGAYLSSNLEDVDFGSHQSVSSWAEEGFVTAFDRAEKLSKHVQRIDGQADIYLL